MSLLSWYRKFGQIKCENMGILFFLFNALWTWFCLFHRVPQHPQVCVCVCVCVCLVSYLWGTNIAYPTGKAFICTAKKDSKQWQLRVKCLSHSLTECRSKPLFDACVIESWRKILKAGEKKTVEEKKQLWNDDMEHETFVDACSGYFIKLEDDTYWLWFEHVQKRM